MWKPCYKDPHIPSIFYLWNKAFIFPEPSTFYQGTHSNQERIVSPTILRTRTYKRVKEEEEKQWRGVTRKKIAGGRSRWNFDAIRRFGCDCFRAMGQSAKEICNNLYLEKRLQILGLDYRWRYEAAKGRSRGSSRGHRKLLCGWRLPGDWQWPLAASLIATTYSRLVASFLYLFNAPSLLCCSFCWNLEDDIYLNGRRGGCFWRKRSSKNGEDIWDSIFYIFLQF